MSLICAYFHPICNASASHALQQVWHCCCTLTHVLLTHDTYAPLLIMAIYYGLPTPAMRRSQIGGVSAVHWPGSPNTTSAKGQPHLSSAGPSRAFQSSTKPPAQDRAATDSVAHSCGPLTAFRHCQLIPPLRAREGSVDMHLKAPCTIFARKPIIVCHRPPCRCQGKIDGAAPRGKKKDGTECRLPACALPGSQNTPILLLLPGYFFCHDGPLLPSPFPNPFPPDAGRSRALPASRSPGRQNCFGCQPVATVDARLGQWISAGAKMETVATSPDVWKPKWVLPSQGEDDIGTSWRLVTSAAGRATHEMVPWECGTCCCSSCVSRCLLSM